jgi:hypothetical protein
MTMPRECYRIVYLDDDPADLQTYKNLLEADKRIKVETVAPTEYMQPELISKYNPALTILDYQLETRQRAGKSATYKGSSLAGAVREKLPDKPIVLLTRGSIWKKYRLGPVRDLEMAYDELLLKKEISENAKNVADRLINLIEGFQTLSEVRRNDWGSLLRLLDARKEEGEDILAANPPRVSGGQIKWRVAEAARWVRSVLLEYPGILYSSLYAATGLGIEDNAFLLPEVQKVFAPSLYTGVFAVESPRWWKQRLLFIANGIMDKAGMLGDPAMRFSASWEKTLGSRLAPSKCVVSDRLHADCVCYSLKKPVLREFSLPYLPDNRPRVMEEARLSFKAIYESNDYDERFIREDVRSVVKRIQREGRNLWSGTK